MDDVANHVIGACGVLDTSITNTLLSVRAVKRNSTITVVNPGTSVAGGYLLLQGHNLAFSAGGDDALLESDGEDVILSEVVQIGSTYVSGTALPMKWPIRQHHGIVEPTSVIAVTPVLGFAVRDMHLDCSNGVTTAVGVLARYAIGIQVHGISVSGCTRATVECVGVKDFYSNKFHSKGSNNNWFHLISVCDGDVSEFSGDDGVPRNNPLGSPRYPFLLKNRCTNVVIRDGSLNGTSAGMYACGGEHLVFHNISVRNVKITDADYVRMVASGELQDGGAVVLGWGAGYGPLGIAEFGFGFTLSNIRIEDIEAPSTGAWTSSVPFRGRAFYLHDVLRLQASNIEIVNRGAESYCCGMVLSDTGGLVSNLMVLGYTVGLAVENVSTAMQIDGFMWDGRRGDSPNDSIPIHLNYHGTNGHTLRINGLRHSSGFSGCRFGASFLTDAVGDGGLVFTDVICDDGNWSRVIVAYNNTGTSFNVGDIVEIDPTWAGDGLRVRIPDTGSTGYERRLAVVANGAPKDYGTAWILIAPLPQEGASAMASSGAIAYGDALKLTTGRRLQADNTVDGTPRVGRALTRKAAGAEGMITIGSIPG